MPCDRGCGRLRNQKRRLVARISDRSLCASSLFSIHEHNHPVTKDNPNPSIGTLRATEVRTASSTLEHEKGKPKFTKKKHFYAKRIDWTKDPPKIFCNDQDWLKAVFFHDDMKPITVVDNEKEAAFKLTVDHESDRVYLHSFLKTANFSNPLLCLTTAATLREKPIITSDKHPLSKYLTTLGITTPESPTVKQEKKDDYADDTLLDGLEEVNLLEGLLAGPDFAKAADQINVPSIRLGATSRQKLFSLPPVLSNVPKQPSPSPMTAVRKAHPTLRKSYRRTLPTVSTFQLRMRTVFVPYVLFPGTEGTVADIDETEIERERREAGSAERTVVLCIEIKNSGGQEAQSGIGFMVESVDIKIAGEGAKTTLVGWGKDGLSADAATTTFPLKLGPFSQVNLLYAVTFLRSPEELDSFSFAKPDAKVRSELRRGVSITVNGKPYTPLTPSARALLTEPDAITLPTRTFASVWSTVLDLDANPAPVLDAFDVSDPTAGYPTALPEPASPFPTSTFGLTSSRMATPMTAMYPPPSAIEGTPHSSAFPGSRKFPLTPGGYFQSKVFGVHYPRSPIGTPTRAQTLPPPSPAIGVFSPGYDESYSAGIQNTYDAVPPTPAYPAFPRKTDLPPSPMSQGPIASQSQSNVGPSVEVRRNRASLPATVGNLPMLQMQQGQPGTPLPHVPAAYGEQRMINKLMNSGASGENVVVSVGLLPVIERGAVGLESSTVEVSGEILGHDKIYPLDTFTLDIFVFNQSTWARRFEVTCPEKRRRRRGGAQTGVYGGGGEGAKKMGYPGVLPMTKRCYESRFELTDAVPRTKKQGETFVSTISHSKLESEIPKPIPICRGVPGSPALLNAIMSTSAGPHFIQEAVFNYVGGNYNDQRQINVSYGPCRDPLDRLEKHVSKGAAHDSTERGPDAPKCDPETRIAVQQDILSWIQFRRHDPNPTNILWLSGPAGAGKTAIMGSIADACHARGWLAGSFFFSAFVPSSPDRRSKGYLIPTLAYHLMHRTTITGLKDHILTAVESNPSVFDKSLDKQLDILILQPLRALSVGANLHETPEVLVIDGVDECDADLDRAFDTKQAIRKSKESNHTELLHTLVRASKDPAFPFLIVIASRPERAIREFFSTNPGSAMELFLDDKYDPGSDIVRFLNSKFSAIRRKFDLSTNWVSESYIQQLKANASGQFIYAATVIRYVEDDTQPPSPPERLQQILKLRRQDASSRSKALAPLDVLYETILQTSPNIPLALRWITMVQRLYGEAEFLLGSLTSLIALVDAEGRPTIAFYHKSLLDFLEDPERCGRLHLSEEDMHIFAQDRFYAVLKNRGPQGTMEDVAGFNTLFCWHLDHALDPVRQYEAGDVDWWLANSNIGIKVVLQFGSCSPGYINSAAGIVARQAARFGGREFYNTAS
ncbi:hypothetical protein NMY22_g6791 [Coprinellus aureogranulatus]|nr:hypothetical protein NMY22_g6791 [Coprinellus aureogranulatus]